jgi:predicted lipoprotein
MSLSSRPSRPKSLLWGVLLTALAPLAFAQPAKELWHSDLAEGYQALVTSAENLQQQSQSYCQAPEKHSLEAVSDAWEEAFNAWQRVRFVDFGPIERDNIAWQLQFWPDSKNLVARKTDNWLKGDQPITAAALAADSVAAKGFPALEYLLFDPSVSGGKHALPDARACGLLQAVSAQIHDNATRLNGDWSRFKSHFLSRPEYADTTVSAAMHSLEILRDKRLAAPMGLGGKGRRNPYIADAWRSGESLETIEATLHGLQNYFLPGFLALMDERQLSPLAEQFGLRLTEALVRLDEMPDAMAPLLKTDEGYRKLQLLYIDLDRLATLLNGPIASELGIIKGFNSSDGD